ncbi:18 kDa seed maturation protein-like [Henckelia pumila]|uniref:18 kDa seed maturation protein-like n=1 Tax=Henckelia pumila TaxID=405737 RepID=UPI003C6DC275
MQSAKETAASAKAGLEKTKAAMQEKGEKMTTRDPLKKDMAEEKKEERMHQAELQKQQEQAAAAAGTAPGMGHGHTAGGDISTGTGHIAEGEVPLDRPRGTDPTGRVLPQDPNVRGGAGTGI